MGKWLITVNQYISLANYRDLASFAFLPEQFVKFMILSALNFIIDVSSSIADMDIEGLLGGSNLSKLKVKEILFALVFRLFLLLHPSKVKDYYRTIQFKLLLVVLAKMLPFPMMQRYVRRVDERFFGY